MTEIVPTLFDFALSDALPPHQTISQNQAEKLFTFFKDHPLFKWEHSNNGCEGRADAVCRLLDEWGIPNYKAWAFSGSYLKKHVGELKQNWKYHVAPLLAVEKDGQIVQYVLDPATAESLQPIEQWAAGITELPHSYYIMRQSHWYIFPPEKIATAKWNSRNSQNQKWVIQSLAGINGISAPGKAALCFNKRLIEKTSIAFNEAKKENPFLSSE